MTNRRFHRLFGGPPRPPESPLEQRHMDLAASIQAVTEEVVLRIGRHVHARTGMKNLVLAGGVALNCVANGRLLREGDFDDLWIQPAAGDAGGALGAALFVWHQLLEKPRQPRRPRRAAGELPRPRGSRPTRSRGSSPSAAPEAAPQRFADESELLETVAALLADGKVVGWFQGRMEFGPRALGRRSILGDPRSPAMQATMNLKIKFRESFRPFAPAVLAGARRRVVRPRAGPGEPLHAPGRAGRSTSGGPRSIPRRCATMQHDPDLRHRVNVVRSEIPAVTHVDYSARLQTVDEVRNPRFYRLLEAFDRLTGCPVLVNTSFNVRGEPIVCTPEDAYRCFLATDMDVLVLEDIVIVKDAAARAAGAAVAQAIPRPVPARLTREARPAMQWSDIPFAPPRKMLRQFAGLWIAFFGGFALWQGLVRGNSTLATVFARAGPDGRPDRPGASRVAAADLRRLDGAGLPDRLDRLAGDPRRDVLRPLHADRPGLPADRPRPAPPPPAGPGQETYWAPKPAPTNLRRYFQQF